jgi:hypothetical protein
MKKIKLLNCLILLAGISVSNVALADHGHGGGHGGGHFGFGLYLGAPYIYPYSPYYYPPYPYAYYPPTVVVPAQPQVYIEQDNQQPAPSQTSAPQANNYWYYCDKPEGYYPYVKECPAGWQKVSPTPPQQ